MAAGKFVKAAAALLRILGDRCALVGGMAVNAHGFVRGTRDVDVIVAMPLAEARRRLQEHGIAVRHFKGDPLQGDFPCLKGVIGVGPRSVEAVPFDILPQLVPIEPERMVELEVRGQKLRVVDPETLIRLKLKAGSTRDLHDIAILANLHPEWGERAMALAASQSGPLGERMADTIRDPRVRGQAREVRRQDSALQAFARGLAKKRRRDGGPER